MILRNRLIYSVIFRYGKESRRMETFIYRKIDLYYKTRLKINEVAISYDGIACPL
jgi:hypothetical protein